MRCRPRPSRWRPCAQAGAAAQQDWGAFADTYAALRDPALKWPADVDLALRWYAGQLERLYDDARVRRADLEQLARIAAGYPSRERFLTELTLDPPDATSDDRARRCATRTT